MSEDKKDGKRIVFSTTAVDEIIKKLDDGFILSNKENPFFDNIKDVRKEGLSFRMTPYEQEEYIKCALDVKYFVKYCKLKTEDGRYRNIKLRDYQEEIMDLINGNKYSILMMSRQSSKTSTTSIYILHYALFNNEKNILIGSNKGESAIEVLDKIKEIYMTLPFFLKKGVKIWNQKVVRFENKCRIKAFSMTKSASIGNTGDLIYLDEFAYIPENIVQPFYKSIVPTMASITNSKLIITSTPNGLNTFSKIYFEAMLPEGHPEKNPFGVMTIRWNKVPGRNMIYIKLDPIRLHRHNITEEEVYAHYKALYNPNDEQDINRVPFSIMKRDPNNNKNVIHILIRENVVDVEDIRASRYKDLSILELADVSTWKEDETKVLGSIEAFNQEYDLRFINTANSILPEKVLDRLNNSIIPFSHYPHDVFSRLKWNYDGLKFITDESIFSIEERKRIKGFMTVDVSEGLGLDYSVINIFRLKPKSTELIMLQHKNFKSQSDFFQLEQIGIFRSNIVSVGQLAEMLYLLGFEFFDEENFKVVLEVNNHGLAVLSEMKGVFEQDNNYSSSIFMRYKHRADSKERSIGLKVGANKNLMVKTYQEKMTEQDIIPHEEVTINEVNTFIKHETAAGNITYKAEGTSKDDSVMTLLHASTVFSELPFKDMCEEYFAMLLQTNPEFKSIYEKVTQSERKEATDYGAFNNVMDRFKGRG